eukprot:4346522-Amphidinium_carterae.3
MSIQPSLCMGSSSRLPHCRQIQTHMRLVGAAKITAPQQRSPCGPSRCCTDLAPQAGGLDWGNDETHMHNFTKIAPNHAIIISPVQLA